MPTLEELAQQIISGMKRVDATVKIGDQLYSAKCYEAGTIMRIDLKKK